MTMYRPEHPRPQFMRKSWMNLNGEWQFEMDQSNSGTARNYFDPDYNFSSRINVPFCPESRLSGIGFTDFINAVWYKRTFELDEEQLQKRILLHFGAVDYEAHVYINGTKCGMHKGGYISFSFDITDYVHAGVNTVTLRAVDDVRSPSIPTGKQCVSYHSSGCFYTRTTGIWQTVWLEFVPRSYIIRTRYTTETGSGVLHISAELEGQGVFQAEAFYEGRPAGTARTDSIGGHAELSIPLSEKHLWEVGKGRLYDLILTFGEDRVESYFGLRSVKLDGYKFLLNGKSVFQRLVLDQGFYPDGVYTAPDDKDLLGDIERSLAMGFNGARLHQKIFEERFLYHCDRMGYLVWGEYPDACMDHTDPANIYNVLPEWTEELERDFNHPAIIGWCPFNESPPDRYKPLQAALYHTTKAIDPTRPCIDTSGYFHVITDIYDVHDYEQDPKKFAEKYRNLPVDGTYQDLSRKQQTYQKGQPFFVSEYGGIGWSVDHAGWSYGNAPKTEEEFLSRLKGLTEVLLKNPCMLGFCYTQLTDIEQEQNGLYTYDRKPKFDPAAVHDILSGKASIED